MQKYKSQLQLKSQLQQKDDALLQCETELKTTKDTFLVSQNQLKNLQIHSGDNKELLKCKIELETTKEKLSHSQNQLKTTKDKLVDSHNNDKATKAKPDPQTTFTNSSQTDTKDRPADPPKKLQNNNDKHPDFQTLLATKDQKGHNIIKTSVFKDCFRMKCTLCHDTFQIDILYFENPQTIFFNSKGPFAKPPDCRPPQTTRP